MKRSFPYTRARRVLALMGDLDFCKSIPKKSIDISRSCISNAIHIDDIIISFVPFFSLHHSSSFGCDSNIITPRPHSLQCFGYRHEQLLAWRRALLPQLGPLPDDASLPLIHLIYGRGAGRTAQQDGVSQSRAYITTRHLQSLPKSLPTVRPPLTSSSHTSLHIYRPSKSQP